MAEPQYKQADPVLISGKVRATVMAPVSHKTTGKWSYNVAVEGANMSLEVMEDDLTLDMAAPEPTAEDRASDAVVDDTVLPKFKVAAIVTTGDGTVATVLAKPVWRNQWDYRLWRHTEGCQIVTLGEGELTAVPPATYGDHAAFRYRHIPTALRLLLLEAAVKQTVTEEGDDICWLDVYVTQASLVGIGFDPALIPKKQLQRQCDQFIDSIYTGCPYGADKLTVQVREHALALELLESAGYAPPGTSLLEAVRHALRDQPVD